MSAEPSLADPTVTASARIRLVTMFTGIVTLVVVMGMGRFSLTPQIPLMIADGHLSLSSAGVLAAMNYIGYLAGALHVCRLRQHHARFLKTGLLLTALVTLLSGFTSDFLLQSVYRFLAGVGGAWALILVTSWTQRVLAQQQAPRMSAAVFTGPGVGITLTGILAGAMTLLQVQDDTAWRVYGLVALAGALGVWRALPDTLPAGMPSSSATLSPALKKLLVAYTLAGFGYILPATFLSQMAHSRFAEGGQAALFWPLFGMAAIAGVLLVIAFAARINTRLTLAAVMMVQGAGVATVVLLPTAGGLLLATVVIGLAFLSIMQLSMRLARESAGGHLARTVAVLTCGYASGQLVGPLVSSASVQFFASLQPALWLAAAGLVAGGSVILRTRF
ncbi:YbfB/YjiJ family MFS transporter [Candidatus Pantoea soli]|uniref:YbfB/YjiJ family MFS transporter n=1 Tax=Candidatus Pantoea soli TaxID=3098669 RepID=A0A518XDI9_9GAMM|nr:YbfB/YjiJ family MFS transporter [Pantoea soli]QDY42225.1 YbfB/YjiJ family MFS transporter [Pantoea soli]